MTRLSLVFRNLRYFRAANLAVIAGMAVATAVLTGALMVGDSVRGSLRDLAVERLGPVDYALSGTRFFDASLAKRIQESATGFQVQPGILIRGGAANDDATRATAGVQIGAIDGSFSPVSRNKVVINSELSNTLGVQSGSTALLRLPVIADAPRDAALTKRSASDVLSGMRVTVDRVETDRGFLSNFTLEGSQRVPRNAWVALPELQDAIGQLNRVNVLLASGPNAVNGEGAKALNDHLRKFIRLSDYGLSMKPSGDGRESVLNSETTYIEGPVADAAQSVADELKAPLQKVSVYLINSVLKEAKASKDVDSPDSPKKIHYAVAAGISDVDGQKLADNEVTLNEWAAKQLGAKVGDRLRLTYYLRQPGGHLAEVASDRPGVDVVLTVVKILPMSGLGADPTLTPEYKGLTDKQSFSDWKPPEGMVIDRKLSDEPYWNKYRAAPKLLVNLDTAHKLWGGTFGDTTSLRVPADKAEVFAARLRETIDPARLGLVFQPIRAQQLAAAVGGTDFSLYFVMFSFFLIVAAAILVAMLFRLNIEQRARQIGVQAAVGFAPGALRGMALQEGMLLALIGGVVGLTGAIGYTWLMVAGLRTWWVDAVGTTAMQLHVVPMTLVIGLASSLAVAFVAILWAVWHVGKVNASRLLAGGWQELASKVKRGWISKGLAIVCGVSGLALIGCGAAGIIDPKGAFMGGGAALLIASLAAVALFLRPRPKTASAAAAMGFSVCGLGVRNASRNTSRSVLSVGLIAFAAFTLVTVAALKEGVSDKTHERDSSAGGYTLMIQADIPLLADPGTPEGRKLLEIDSNNPSLWNGVTFAPMRSWQGQDISCLNLTKPNTPSILAVSHAMVERGGFVKEENPLKLLETPMGDDGSVPVIADAETAEYILHLGIGDTMPLTDQLGNPRKLKLVATLPQSLFQSEMLMGEANFQKLFPSQAGFGTVLIDVPREREEEVRKVLSTALEQNAAVVDRTADRLARYAQVKNTYLSTFQTLGSLGLMLGTIGLAVVLLRSIVERRSELALLTALGFARRSRLGLVLSENAFLLVLGLVVGTGCAMLGVAPEFFSSHRTVNVAALALTLFAVLMIGLASLVLAVWIGQRNLAPADLRSE